MGELTTEAFAEWWHPSDVIDRFLYLGDAHAKSRVIAMLTDGLLRSAARQFIVDGRQQGLTLIPRQLWTTIGSTSVWATSDFVLTGMLGRKAWRISAYEVRIDPADQELPDPDRLAPRRRSDQPDQAAISSAALTRWFDLFIAAYPNGSIERAWASAKGMFPDKRITRQQVRALMPDRPKGRPRKNNDNP